MEKWSLRTPSRGDIIRVNLNNKYYHYGIYVDDDTIIQYGRFDDMLKKNASDIEVLITNISDFSFKKFVEVYNYSLKEKLKKNKPDIVIEKAMSRLGEQKYNIVNNNCEHFVYECVFNKHDIF